MMKPVTLTWLVLLGCLVALPLVNDNSYLRHIAIVALLYASLVSSWNLTLGFAGVFNFGHMAFFAIGAYTAAILTKTAGLSPWTGFAAAICTSVVASIVVCLPVLRLKGIYVVLVTFAFGQLCYQVVLNQRDITAEPSASSRSRRWRSPATPSPPTSTSATTTPPCCCWSPRRST